MKSDIPYELIVKYLEGKTSTPEEQRVEHWLSEEPGNEKRLIEFTHLWVGNLNAPLIVSNDAMTQAWHALKPQPEQAKPTKMTPLWMGSIAAALALVLTAWFLLKAPTSDKPLSFANNTMEDSLVVLPNGSKITLSPETIIHFYNQPASDSPTIALQGEAWVEVLEGNIPLVLTFDGYKAAVPKGKYFVNATSGENEISIFVEEGYAQIAPTGSHEGLAIVCNSNQAVHIQPHHQFVHITDARQIPTWVTQSPPFNFPSNSLSGKLFELSSMIGLPLGSIPTCFDDSVIDFGESDTHLPGELFLDLLERNRAQLISNEDKFDIVLTKSL